MGMCFSSQMLHAADQDWLVQVVGYIFMQPKRYVPFLELINIFCVTICLKVALGIMSFNL